MIDLRSDTVTRPSPAMREAMARAEVGDDVFGEDPTVQALQEEIAEITGKEAALFVSSGTMGNQLAIATQTRHGDEVIVGEGAHPVWYEGAAGAALSGVQCREIGRDGIYSAEELESAIRPAVYWSPRTSLVCVENTHNRGGGRIFPQAEAQAVAARARSRGLALHLDGARLWNASVATGLAIPELAAPFDTVSVCFSKGLGAPVGSALCGPRSLIDEARRIRKRWGGAMRQSGILAAGARYALANNRARLADDHANAKLIATRLASSPGVRLDLASVQTNIVNIDLDGPRNAEPLSKILQDAGVAINAYGPKRLRAVTHMDVSRADVERAVDILARTIAGAT